MWLYIVMLIIVILLAVFMPMPTAAAPERGIIKVTTASEGATIPVLFGTRDIHSQNVLWAGDKSAVAVRKSGGKK
jgi:hypothetical protein